MPTDSNSITFSNDMSLYVGDSSLRIMQNNDTESSNYTIIEPEYLYFERFNEFVEWYVNGENASFWVNYSYALRVWVQDNISVVFDASYKTSAVCDSEEVSFDVLTEYKLSDTETVGSQFHLGSLVPSYIEIPNYGRFYISFKNAKAVVSSPIIHGHKGIYPFIAWNFTYINITAPFSDIEDSVLNFTVLNYLIIKENEFKIKIGILIELFKFNYSLLEPFVGENGTFDFVVANSFGVMYSNTSGGTPAVSYTHLTLPTTERV